MEDRSWERIVSPEDGPTVVKLLIQGLSGPFAKIKPYEKASFDGLSGQCLVAFGSQDDYGLRHFPLGVPMLSLYVLRVLDYGIVW